MYKLLLVQLPLIYYRFEFREKFIPLSLGYLEAQLRHCENLYVEILPLYESCLSDESLFKAIVNRKPNAIGFSCYVWNTDRTIFLVEKIKRTFPNITIILGGPDVSKDNTLIFNQNVDILVFGDGEETIVKVMNHLKNNRSLRNIPNLAYKDEVVDKFHFTETNTLPKNQSLDFIKSPYNDITIGHIGEINYALLEIRRGCPFSCAYCYYGKGESGTRSFSLDRVASDFMFIKKLNIDSIYLIDPCINSHKEFEKVMKTLAEINAEPKLEIQAEIRAELLNEQQVKLMKKANVTRVEVGLQSSNKNVLREINRATDFRRFEKGVDLLQKNGIKVVIGAINGLPGDKLDSMKKTLDYMVGRFPEADKHIYPLSVLPNTKIRQNSDKWDMDFQQKPPYLVIRNADIDSVGLNEAFINCEPALANTFSSLPLLSFFSGSAKSFKKIELTDIVDIPIISRLFLYESESTLALMRKLVLGKVRARFANSLVIYIKSVNHGNDILTLFNEFLIRLYKNNPFLIVNIFFDLTEFSINEVPLIFKNIRRKRGFLDYANFYQNDLFIIKAKSESVNGSIRVFYLDKGRSFLESVIRPINEIIFDDASPVLGRDYIIYNERGFLIETEKETLSLDFFKQLRRVIKPKRDVRFKNLISQKVWDETINKAPTNLPLGEHAIISTDNIKTAYFEKNEIMLDAAEWLILNKK